MTIQTARLTLRQIEPGDADWIARDITNENVAQWLTALPWPYHLRDAEEFVARVAPDPGYRVIVADRPVGVISVEIRANVPELGYWLVEEAWGQGFMTEAASGLVAWVFDQGHACVDSGWLIGNAASENVLTKLGFIATGEVKQTTCTFHPDPVAVKRVRLTAERFKNRQNA